MPASTNRPHRLLKRRQFLQAMAIGGLSLGCGLPLHAEPLRRVVAINWGAAETLLTLGVEPLAISDVGYYRRRMPGSPLPQTVLDIGPYWEPNLELLHQLNPQLILSDALPNSVLHALGDIAPTEVVNIFPTDKGVWNSASAFMRQLAERLHLSDRADVYLQAAEQRLEVLRTRLALRPQPALYIAVLNQDGRHATVYGQHSMAQDVLERLGLRNAWSGPSNAMGFSLTGIERLSEQPDAHLLYIEIPTTSARLQSLRQPNALWDNLPAVRRSQVHALGKFYPYGGVASFLSLAERIADYLDSQEMRHG